MTQRMLIIPPQFIGKAYEREDGAKLKIFLGFDVDTQELIKVWCPLDVFTTLAIQNQIKRNLGQNVFLANFLEDEEGRENLSDLKLGSRYKIVLDTATAAE